MIVFYTTSSKVTSSNFAKSKEWLVCANLMNIKRGDIISSKLEL